MEGANHCAMIKDPFDQYALRLRQDDDVAVAKRTIKAGTRLFQGGLEFEAAATIPAGHKLAVNALATGMPVRKYGQVIGFASRPITPGEHVHTHNLAMHDFQRQY